MLLVSCDSVVYCALPLYCEVDVLPYDIDALLSEAGGMILTCIVVC